MVITFDSIQPEYSVTVAASRNNNPLVRVEFARGVDHEVLKEMHGLEAQSFSKFVLVSPNGKMFDVFVNSNYPLETVAEAIAQMLEGHGLKVGRLAGLSEWDKVSSFAGQLKQDGDRDV